MVRRYAPRNDLLRSDPSVRWRGAPVVAEKKATSSGSRLGPTVPIAAAVGAGLMLGAAIALFTNGPADLRLQAYEVFGVGAPRSCEEARELGIGPARRGERHYFAHLDRDGDGVSCVYVPGEGFR